MRKQVVLLFVGLILASCGKIIDTEHNNGPILSWSDDPATTVDITWVVSDSEVASVLTWGTNASSLSKSESAQIDATNIRRVYLKNLTPDTQYYYQISDVLNLSVTQENGRPVFDKNPVFSFKTAPSDSTGQLDFAIMGDIQPGNNDSTQKNSRQSFAKLKTLPIDFIVQLGDIFDVGNDPVYVDWSLQAIPVGAAYKPFLAVVGNHDYFWTNPNATYFKQIFSYPYESTISNRHSCYYSHDIQKAHLVFLDSESWRLTDFGIQKRWLIRDLDEAVAKGQKWFFFFIHVPMVSRWPDCDPYILEWLAPVMAEYQIDGIFWGHDHMYSYYEYPFGKEGRVFKEGQPAAKEPLRMWCSGGGGHKLDYLYSDDFFNTTCISNSSLHFANGTFDFVSRYWNINDCKTDLNKLPYMEPESEKTPAGVYYLYPFDSAQDYHDGKLSANWQNSYSGDLELFGFKYAENSLHYIRVNLDNEKCVISVHYYDQDEGVDGTMMTTPDGVEQKWTFSPKNR